MRCHVIWDLLHKLFENDENEALPWFYCLLITFLIASMINSVLHDQEFNVLFISKRFS